MYLIFSIPAAALLFIGAVKIGEAIAGKEW